MILRSKLISNGGCGTGDLALEVFKQKPLTSAALPDFTIKHPTINNQNRALVLSLILKEKNFLALSAWWGNQEPHYCTSTSDQVIKALEVSGFKFEKPFFSGSICYSLYYPPRHGLAWCTIPTCGCSSPHQVQFKIVMDLALSQMAVREDWFDQLIEQDKLFRKDNANIELITHFILPRLNQTLNSMRILFEEKQKAWNPADKILPNVKPSIASRANSLANKVACSRAATDKAFFLAFEKQLDDKLNAGVKANNLTEIEAQYIKATIINHLVMRNKTMAGFINARTQMAQAPKPNSAQLADAKCNLDMKMNVRMLRA